MVAVALKSSEQQDMLSECTSGQETLGPQRLAALRDLSSLNARPQLPLCSDRHPSITPLILNLPYKSLVMLRRSRFAGNESLGDGLTSGDALLM